MDRCAVPIYYSSSSYPVLLLHTNEMVIDDDNRDFSRVFKRLPRVRNAVGKGFLARCNLGNATKETWEIKNGLPAWTRFPD